MDELDQLVRRVDEDRWLASRFAPAPVRARLVAIYAVNYEIARTAETVSEGALGSIRLAWWREALAEMAGGQSTRAHPALEALSRAEPPDVVLSLLQGIIEARTRDCGTTAFANWAELETYVDATAGGVLRAALAMCGAAENPPPYAKFVGWAWGFAGLARAAPYWAARGRAVWPAKDLIDGAEGAYVDAQRMVSKLSSAHFPAIGYVATLPGYLRGLREGRVDRPLLLRQLAIIAASATGRI